MAKRLPAVILFGVLLLTSCVAIIKRGRVESITPDEVRTSVVTVPMKAFLRNGEVVIYDGGADVTATEIQGPGRRYSLNREASTPVTTIPMDSVLGMEAFDASVDVPASIALSALGTGLAVGGGSALAVAIFGSCPTFYTSPESGSVLQAEAFSYSVADRLERQDLDRLSIQPDPDGVLRIELRNEALETHYINHLALLAVEHAPEVQVIPDADHEVLGFRDPAPPVSARDRDGRDVSGELLKTDGLAFSSTVSRILASADEDSRDYVEMTFEPPPSEEAVLILDLRNSLLNTVLFYDLMLSTAGAKAINWWGGSFKDIQTGIDLAHWYMDNLGLEVESWRSGRWRTEASVVGIGPIAWKMLGVRIPVPREGPVRIRLSFLADDWRIDRAALASRADVENVKEVPINALIAQGGQPLASPTDYLSRPDRDYFITYPGTSAILEFLPEATGSGNASTYLLATQGYYVEWMRPEWVRRAQEDPPFHTGPGAVEILMDAWLKKRETMEKEFFESRIPVR